MLLSLLQAARINMGEENDWSGAFSFYLSDNISPDGIFFGVSLLVSNLLKKYKLE